MIAHQRLAPVAPPPLYSANRLSALYADAMEPILIQVVPRYNPAAYLDDTFTTSMQVSCCRRPWISFRKIPNRFPIIPNGDARLLLLRKEYRNKMMFVFIRINWLGGR